MEDEELKSVLVALQCDIRITQILLTELIAQAPDPERVLQGLKAEIDQMSADRPADIDLEEVVELRARAEQLVVIARNTLRSANALARSRRPPA